MTMITRREGPRKCGSKGRDFHAVRISRESSERAIHLSVMKANCWRRTESRARLISHSKQNYVEQYESPAPDPTRFFRPSRAFHDGNFFLFHLKSYGRTRSDVHKSPSSLGEKKKKKKANPRSSSSRLTLLQLPGRTGRVSFPPVGLIYGGHSTPAKRHKRGKIRN